MTDLPPRAWARTRPFATHALPVGDGHVLHVAEHGHPEGEPVVFLHGGPGGGCGPESAMFFDPQRWRVVLIDQRGAGRSRPHAGLEANTTWHLVADIERVREKLQLDAWHVFGGSWGSTLSLCYALLHRERVKSLTLRGIFVGTEAEFDWLYRPGGASAFFPEAWQDFLAPLSDAERADPLRHYHRRITSPDDPEDALTCARVWSRWEGAIARLRTDNAQLSSFENAAFARSFASIETHYFVHGCFLERDGWLLERASELSGIPTTIVQGRYDVICPPRMAWALAQAIEGAELIFTLAGHAASEPDTARALAATMRSRLDG